MAKAFFDSDADLALILTGVLLNAVAQLLLDAGADLHARVRGDWSVLRCAIAGAANGECLRGCRSLTPQAPRLRETPAAECNEDNRAALQNRRSIAVEVSRTPRLCRVQRQA